MTLINKIWILLFMATICIILDMIFPVIKGYMIENPFKFFSNMIVISAFMGLSIIKYEISKGE